MAITRVKTFITGEVLTASDLNSELDNPINNALSLISPLTGNLDFGTTRALTAGPLVIHVSPEDARTATVDIAAELRSTTSGTPAADIGTGLLFSAESADENPSEVGQLNFAFSDITAASEDSYADVLLRTAGAALGGRYRLQATGAFLATITHALTAARTLTLPNETGTVGLVGTPALTLGTVNSAGTANTVVRTDATILAFDTTLPANVGTAAVGTATVASRRDHVHAGSTTVQQDTVRKTTDFTTTSTSFVDVTNLTITITTGARRVLLTACGAVANDTAGQQSKLTLTVDGANQGGTNGLQFADHIAATELHPFSLSFLTDVLTAASHTFKVQALASGGTTTIRGNPTFVFNAVEILPAS